jgi:hypothetical protein
MSTKNIVSNRESQSIDGDLSVRSLTLDNGAKLRVGTGVNDGSGGIARECVIGFEDKWEAGVQYYKDISGPIIYAVSINGNYPDETFDSSKGYQTGTTYFLANSGDIYKCVSANLGSAVWKIVNNIVPKYRVYTALLTQSGTGNNGQTITGGTLTIGITYLISEHQTGDDFTNVGAPNNNNGTYFLATGTTPAEWGSASTLQYDASAPTINILDNTLGATVTATYYNVGSYNLNLSFPVLTEGKTFITTGYTDNPTLGESSIQSLVSSTTSINVRTRGDVGEYFDGILSNTPIEIRVYN